MFLSYFKQTVKQFIITIFSGSENVICIEIFLGVLFYFFQKATFFLTFESKTNRNSKIKTLIHCVFFFELH